jgi:hypothetical protein
VIRQSSARVVLPTSDESGAAAAPNPLARILREWPDAAARAAIVAVAFTLFWLTWAHWGSIQVDCGREVYVPYQILRGKLLYRDLWYPYGPLEPYISALLLKLFGEHLNVLYFLGLSLVIACALVLFDLGKLVAGRAVGLTVGLALLLWGFNFTIFNYIFPYTYSAPMGMLFSLICLFLTLRHVLDGRSLMFAGLAAGLTLITKQEMGIACYIMLAFVLLAEIVIQRSVRGLLSDVAACAPGLLLAAAVYGWFFWKVTPEVILHANWQFAPGSYFLRTYGARASANIGLRFVPSELLSLIVNGAGALLAWVFLSKVGRNLKRWSFFIIVAFLATILALVHYSAAPFGRANNVAWYVLLFPRGMFFIGCAFFAYAMNQLRRKPCERGLLAESTLGFFALLCAIRVMAETSPFEYSVFYTVPLFLVFIIAISRCMAMAAPSLPLERRCVFVNSLLAAEIILFAAVVLPIRSGRTTKFESGWGAIYLTADNARTARQILDFMLQQKQDGRRVVLVPELPIMYAFAASEAPSRWYSVVAGYMSPDQERGYVTELGRARPDYVIYCDRPLTWNWNPVFGRDYDRAVYEWMDTNYKVVGEFGHFQADSGVALAGLLYQRRYEPSRVTH